MSGGRTQRRKPPHSERVAAIEAAGWEREGGNAFRHPQVYGTVTLARAEAVSRENGLAVCR